MSLEWERKSKFFWNSTDGRYLISVSGCPPDLKHEAWLADENLEKLSLVGDGSTHQQARDIAQAHADEG